MEFTHSQRGILVKRYKRFFMEISTNHQMITAHCPNTGPMSGLLREGSPVIFTPIKSTLGYQCQMIFTDSTWVGINTILANRLFREFMEEDPLNLFSKQEGFKVFPEYSTKNITGSNHKLDFYVENCQLDWETIGGHMPFHAIKYQPSKPLLVEVKFTHWKVGDICYFPDATTIRGTGQLRSLAGQAPLSTNTLWKKKKSIKYAPGSPLRLPSEGPSPQEIKNLKCLTDQYNILLVFMLQREDCDQVALASAIDPLFHEAVHLLMDQGAMVMALGCNVNPTTIKVCKLLRFLG